MLQRLIKYGFVLLFAGHALLAIAAEEDDLLSLYDEEDLITIATGTQKQVKFAPSVATIITAEQIAASGARLLAEVLESVPGIHVGDALLFDDDMISIRGIQTSNNPQVLVQIDGVEVRHLFTAARPAGFRLPLANVYRIEIIRGPGSAVHGADAFAGVINVITKTGAQINGTEIGARYGSFNTQDVWLNAGSANDDIEWAFSHEYSRTNGDHGRKVQSNIPIFSAGDFRSEYEIFNTQLKASKDGWTARLHNWRLSNGGNGPGGAQVPDQAGEVETDYYQFDLAKKNQLNAYLQLDARVGYHHGETDIDNVLFPAGNFTVLPDGNPIPLPCAPGPADCYSFAQGVIGNPGGEANVIDTDFALLFTGLNNHVFRFGVGYIKESVDIEESKNFGPGVLDPTAAEPRVAPATPVVVTGTQFAFLQNVDREAYHVSVQDEIRLNNDVELTVGLRFDEFNDVGGALNPRLALVWAVDYNLTTKFLYGRAFRAPSFTELFSKNNPSQLGNDQLEPETINTFEAALDYKVHPQWDMQANAFYYEIDDLIDFVPSAAGFVAQNAIDQTGYGLELSTSWEASDSVTLSANASLQKVEDEQTKEDVADVPNALLFAGARWRPRSGLQLNAEVHWVSERERAMGDSRPDLDDYTLVNLALRKDFAESGLALGATIRNLFDE
ncbi:MAG: TonB-dependent receptor, partial [Pseudomonadales bacterium]